MTESGDDGYGSDVGYDTEQSHSGESEPEEEPKVTLQFHDPNREGHCFLASCILISNIISMMWVRKQSRDEEKGVPKQGGPSGGAWGRTWTDPQTGLVFDCE